MAESNWFLLSRADRDKLRKMRRQLDAMNQNVVGGKRFRAKRPSNNSFDAWYPFYNDSGETIPGNAMMRVTDSTDAGQETGQSAGSGNPILKCKKPSTEFWKRYVVNGPYEVEVGGFGWCLTRGPCLMIYDTGTPANGEGWGPKPGQWSLSKGYPCTTIVDDMHTSSAPKLLLGTLGEINTLLCKATASLSAGSVTSNYTIQSGNPSSSADAGFTTLPTLHLGADIDDDLHFYAFWVNNCWLAVPWECNA